MEQNAVHIGIIGMGPKGLYGFERLLANLHAIECETIHIHLFNISKLFGSGWIYDPSQPDFLKMNYPNKFISLKPHNNPPEICPIKSFSEWQADKNQTAIEDENFNIAARAEVGKYLFHYFKKLCFCSSNNLKIHKHVTEVKSIVKFEDLYLLQTLDPHFKSPHFSSLLITTGHSPSITSKINSGKDKKDTIPFIYPVNSKLKSIKPNSVVACKGLGLTAIDAILALTEGRGGTFYTDNKGKMSFHTSGKEPLKIYPFSISGNPIIPRNYSQTVSQQSFYFKKFVENNTSSSKLLDFETDLLPIIKQDMIGEYYFQTFKKYGESLNLKQRFTNVASHIANFHLKHPTVQEFKPSDLLYPDFDSNFLNLQLQVYWKGWLNEIQTSNNSLVAAATVWKNISDDFNILYSNNRLTSSSKATFLNHYFSLFNRISYGPPMSNIKKMLAIAEQGILDFSFAKNPQIEESGKISKLTRNEKSEIFHVMIDARIPRGYNKNDSVLFTKNQAKSIFTFNRTTSKYNYANTLICNSNGNPIDTYGNTDINITLYGTPTEGFLFDNDSLSRKRNDTASLWANNVAELIQQNKQTPIYEK